MNEFVEQFEIIPGQFYFCTKEKDRPMSQSNKFLYFTTDSTLQYTPFFADFGPLHIGLTYNFCEQLDTLLTQGGVERKPVIYFTTTHPHHRSNSAVLICAYLIFVKGYTAELAYEPFIGVTPMLTTFRDAAFAINTYPLTVLDCARAFYRVHCLHHFVYNSFDIFKHDHLSKLENGDISWIIPGKFIAFSGPVSTPRELSPGVFALPPEGYVPLFKSLGVTCIIRFNKKCYDRNIFVRSGIKHVDLYYEDGGNPTDAILQAFLTTCENERGSIAVHCKAGLGRTGTNIAAYMMKHYGYSAKEATAWCRVCRPGCVVGPQQQYLETIQERMWQEGRRYRNERQQSGQSHSNSNSTPMVSRGMINKGARLNNEMIGSSQILPVEHFESSITSRLVKTHEQMTHTSLTNGGVSTGGGGILSRSINGSITDRERTPSITTRPNTSSGIDSTPHDRERRDSRNSRKGSGNIDWTMQHESKQLTITTSSASASSSTAAAPPQAAAATTSTRTTSSSSFARPKTSYTEGDITKNISNTLTDLHEKKQSFQSTTTTTTTSASNGSSSRSTGSNSSATTTGHSQTEERSSLSRLLFSSNTTKTKLKSSTTTTTTNTNSNSNSQSLPSREGHPRKNSFGKSNVANTATQMKKLTVK